MKTHTTQTITTKPRLSKPRIADNLRSYRLQQRRRRMIAAAVTLTIAALIGWLCK